MSPATYDKQFTVQVTEQMLHFIDLIAKRQGTSRAEVTRQALREYLDAQEELIGKIDVLLGGRAAEKIVFDKFHVAKHLGEGVDKVRRADNKEPPIPWHCRRSWSARLVFWDQASAAASVPWWRTA